MISLLFLMLCHSVVDIRSDVDLLYPYGPDAGDTTLDELDDWYIAVPIPSNVTFFNSSYEEIFISDNGDLSFDEPYYEYSWTPNFDIPILLPMYNDWDITGRLQSHIHFRSVTSGPLLSQLTEDVKQGLTTNSALNINFEAAWALIVTYDDIPAWGAVFEDPRNLVQVVIVSDYQRTFVLYQYAYIGVYFVSYSGYAIVGYWYMGSMREHPYSNSDDVEDLPSWSNVHIPGRTMLQIDTWCEEGLCNDKGFCLEGGHCLCFDAYTGFHCETEVDECVGITCNGRGRCIDGYASFQCECDEGFLGIQCQIVDDLCGEDSCGEHGTCIERGFTYLCECDAGYTGTMCETEINECLSCPCLYGSCQDIVDGYICECEDGFTGRMCNIDVDYCLGPACLHGGLCVDARHNYSCLCEPGFFGLTCAEERDECETHNTRCLYGRCVDDINKIRCECLPGYSGKHCNQAVDECLSSPCLHGTCVDDVNGYSCICTAGYTGDLCETDTVDCEPELCSSKNGYCLERLDDYECACFPGFTGKHCEHIIYNCLSLPCEHGTCLDTENGFHCTCEDGFTGKTCTVNVDDCDQSVCVHGDCVDGLNAYTCSCHAGYTGMLCENSVNDCRPDVCQNGHCVDALDGYVCQCFPGYTGESCETNVDNCHQSACTEGATCVDAVNGYWCACPDDMTGPQCEVNDRPTAGTWDSWAAWTLCDSLCGVGFRTRYRQCLQNPCNDSNWERHQCNTHSCHEFYNNMNVVTLSSSASATQVSSNEMVIRDTIADSMNDYCSNNRPKCCSLIDITTPSLMTSFDIFRTDSIYMATSDVSQVDGTRLELLVLTRVPDLRYACTGRRQRSIPVTYTDQYFLHVPRYIVTPAIEANMETLDQVLCCWHVASVEPPENTDVKTILIGVLVPVGVLILLLLLLVCFTKSTPNKKRVQSYYSTRPVPTASRPRATPVIVGADPRAYWQYMNNMRRIPAIRY